MVGFDPDGKKNLTKTDHAVAGAVSGAVARFLIQPLDVLKIRFQLQVEPIRRGETGSKYWGVLQASRCIFQEEGTKAFWKGHVPAQLLSVVYGVTQYVSFESLTMHAWHLLPGVQEKRYQPLIYFVCGGLAGSLATLTSMPFDVVRTRLVGQSEPKVYRGITHAVLTMYQKEGPRSFYRGLVPTLVQIAPYSGAQFAFYKFFSETLKSLRRSVGATVGDYPYITDSLISGSLSGICSKTLVYPLDLTKKRLQIQGFEEARKVFGKVEHYKGFVHCLVQMARAEGLSAWFKGLSPSLLKAMAATSLNFCFYEQTCKLLATAKRT